MNKESQKDIYIKAITTRDPSKRQIKPIDKDAFQLFEDLESDSDDDYVADSDELSEDGDKPASVDTKSDKNNDDSSSSSEESEEDDKSVENKSEVRNEVIENDVEDIIHKRSKTENVMICMMCLLDDTYSDNEIVECDSCGIMVHEDCYKISDAVYMNDDSSDASTDPWFCDACLCNVKQPMCELCPIQGGVFKKTEHNRWVHLICALYTSGVAFNDPDNITEITLSEIPYKEWSSRECTLCTNSLYARTGICISCDAGLCKNYFHVTCAQKEGLLSEPNIDENPDDPFFAQCRQHTDKDIAKRRRKNFTAAQNRRKLRLQEWQENQHQNDSRIKRKLQFFSETYDNNKDSLPTPFVPSTKVPLFLETSPVAVFLFIKKAQNLHLSMDTFNSLTTNESKYISGSGGPPSFSPDFISYFLDREKRIDETKNEIVRLETYLREMEINEQNTSHQFNRVTIKYEDLTRKYQEKFSQIKLMFDLIKSMSKDKVVLDKLEILIKKFEPVAPTSNHTTTLGTVNGIQENAVSHSNGHKETNNKQDNSNCIINECAICKRVRDQHLLIDCDNCHQYFHLNCLDPPLARMPKKTKLYGWQCSNCNPSSDEDNNKDEIDVTKPRQLRKSATRFHHNKFNKTFDESNPAKPPKTSRSLSSRISKNLINEARRRQNNKSSSSTKSKQSSKKNNILSLISNSSDSARRVKTKEKNNKKKTLSVTRRNSNEYSSNSCRTSSSSCDENHEEETNSSIKKEESLNTSPKSSSIQRTSSRTKKRPKNLIDEIEGPHQVKRKKTQITIAKEGTEVNNNNNTRCITDFFHSIDKNNNTNSSTTSSIIVRSNPEVNSSTSTTGSELKLKIKQQPIIFSGDSSEKRQENTTGESQYQIGTIISRKPSRISISGNSAATSSSVPSSTVTNYRIVASTYNSNNSDASSNKDDINNISFKKIIKIKLHQDKEENNL